MKKILLAFVILLLAGCQTSAQFEQNMMSWKGLSIDSMVQEWGYPNGELKSPDGNRVYVYSNAGSYYVPQSTNYNTTSNVVGNSVYSNTYATSTGGYSIEYSCAIYVVFGDDKVIKNITWRGNNCVA